MNKKNFLIGYKIFFALLGLSSLVTEVVILIERGVFHLGNFASFFTVESNVIAAVMFMISAFFLYAGKKSARLDFFRGAATLYMVVTGIVFALLLSSLEGVQLTAVPWDNTVLHYIIPIAIVVDWFIDPVRKISFRKGLAWLAFPIAYLGYSLVRGVVTGWYPYPFLNPSNGGYGQIALTSLGIFALGIALVFLVTRIGLKAKK